MNYSDKLKDRIRLIPEKPGIYKYYDDTGNIIYVGKAKNLKKRVSSYFTKNHDSGKTRILVKKIHEIEYIIVDSESDALFLENSLIKKYQPRYNIQLKDDKTYPWICIKNEPFPRVFSTRRVIKDGSKYFGPYPSVKIVSTLLDLIRELFPLRTCSLDLQTSKIEGRQFKPCLEYHIGNCKAPCIGKETSESYKNYIQQIEHILKGNLSQVVNLLKQQMHKAAEQLSFEEAQVFKEKITIIEQYKAKSTVVSPTIHHIDVATVEMTVKKAFVNYLVISNGAIIHGHTLQITKKLDETEKEILSFVIPEMRDRFNSQSKEVLLEKDYDDFSLPGISFSVPQRGDKKKLVELSKRNAKYVRLEKEKQAHLKSPEKKVERILLQIQKDFRLKELPVHMECFDNSNFQGTNAVSACVVFKNAKPSKKDYRHFNIKTVIGPDDFASMREALYRRYKRLLEEKQPLPQLVIVDGGKGQLSAGIKALEELGLKGKLPIVGIAKRLEEIFFPGDSTPLYIDKKSESLKIIQYMRNEAHRFGIEHHRNKRSKSAIVSIFDEINGIGPKTKEELLHHFKSLATIKKASESEISKVIGPSKAKKVYNYLQGLS